MKLSKKLLTAAFAVTLCCGLASCGSSDSATTSNTSSDKGEIKLDEDQAKTVADLKSKLPDTELKNKKIIWLAHYDINPGKGQLEDPGISLFKEKYGGTIEYRKTTWDNRYTDLAKQVMTSDAPDFFPANDMDAFPKGAISNMFEPIDDVIDLNSDIWSSSKTINDSFVFQGKHYVAAIEAAPRYVCIYNKKTMEENQYDQPADLYKNNEWTWSKFTEMCKDFTDDTAEKYALDGYWYTCALNDTCGVPLIGLKDGKIVNNMGDSAVAKVQDLMYQLQKNGVAYPRCDNGWKTRGNGDTGDGLGSNLTLFIPAGMYVLENNADNTKLLGSIKDGEVMFAPMPRLDDSDKYYQSSLIDGYLLCKNAPNPEGFAAFVNCKKVTATEASDIHVQQLKKEYNWTDEMIEMREEVYKLASENPVFDFSYGVNADLRTIMENTVNQATMVTGDGTLTWTATVEKYKKLVDSLVADANSKLK